VTAAGTDQRPTLILIVSAAPPARHIAELVTALQLQGWDVHAVTTPTAAAWVDQDNVAMLTGHPVRTEARRPAEPKTLPAANAIAVVPATFNTINKWAAGINDTLALGILNEALGSALPILVVPYAKKTLTNHPVFARSLDFLRQAGAKLTATEAIRPTSDDQPFAWHIVLDELAMLIRER
jgi:phosphopantothenoylcysteine decarboxylase